MYKFQKVRICDSYNHYLDKYPHILKYLTKEELLLKNNIILNEYTKNKHNEIMNNIINNLKFNNVSKEEIQSFILDPKVKIETLIKNKTFNDNALNNSILILKKEDFVGMSFENKKLNKIYKLTTTDFSKKACKVKITKTTFEKDKYYDYLEKLIKLYKEKYKVYDEKIDKKIKDASKRLYFDTLEEKSLDQELIVNDINLFVSAFKLKNNLNYSSKKTSELILDNRLLRPDIKQKTKDIK